jgi:signal transduction histidine kinase
MNTAVDARPLRVVIIDDTADLRDLLRIALARGGMSVIGEAGDGEAGIEAVRTGRPDVILLDLSMPVMDGLAALPHLRTLAPDAKIIVLSGFGADELTDRALEAGADGYLQKGVPLGRILDYIREITADRVLGPPLDLPTEDADGQDSSIRPADTESHPDFLREEVVWSEALARAPFGIIEVGADKPYGLIGLNVAARDLLNGGPLLAGTPLHQICPELATAIADTRLQGAVDFEADTGSQLVRVSLRPGAASLLIYLHRVNDEAAILRSAIATTAHEIRGPVGVLSGVAETLAMVGDGELDPKLRGRLMETAQRQSRQLESITADLLTAAQIQRGTLRVALRQVDPVSVISTLVKDRYPDSVTIEPGDRRPILADALRLEQMIGNLLCNAHKYGQPPIEMRTRPSAEAPELLCIDVEDHGPGISDEFQAQMFHEFSRAPSTSAVSGTGLGLHVVRSLAHAQGGTVSYTAGRDGGAIFTLTMRTFTS